MRPPAHTGFSPRVSFDVTRTNLWGMAHSISLRTRVSTLEQRGLLNYSWPRFARQRQPQRLVHRPYSRTPTTSARSTTSARKARRNCTQRLTKSITLFYRYAYRRVGVDQRL